MMAAILNGPRITLLVAPGRGARLDVGGCIDDVDDDSTRTMGVESPGRDVGRRMKYVADVNRRTAGIERLGHDVKDVNKGTVGIGG